ncbi:MAG: hypothetical protein JRJ23_05480 [Deltaproteobacteria bacterium]|nr:hypothetical protein [Deltaproteobacteria bacterium]
MISCILKRIFHGFCAFGLILFFLNPLQAQEEETNYSISLTKTAETQEGKDIHEVNDKKVLAQEYMRLMTKRSWLRNILFRMVIMCGSF